MLLFLGCQPPICSQHTATLTHAPRAPSCAPDHACRAEHAAALFAYTEETPLYGTLNYTMRTPGERTPLAARLSPLA